jgi:hypothetical protein
MSSTKKIKKSLIEKGFITFFASDDPLSHDQIEMVHNLFNVKGEYLGDFLLEKGFVKKSFMKRKKTWISYSDGVNTFTHRDLVEYPTKTFSASRTVGEAMEQAGNKPKYIPLDHEKLKDFNNIIVGKPNKKG